MWESESSLMDAGQTLHHRAVSLASFFNFKKGFEIESFLLFR